jgi:putative peptide zinc metalloprotease protein
VEYSPLTVVRAAAPGFVEKILVASGEEVAQGQPLVILRNDSLAAELADIDLACEQSLVKSRMHVQAQDAAQQQMEAADRRAMEKKRHELRQRIASLTVRAPAAGRVYARGLNALIDRYLATGDEVAVVGREDSKELLVAVPQEDVELFEHRAGRREIHVSTASGDRFPAHLSTVDPRGGNALPHPAFSAMVGGPLAVKAVARTAESTAKPDGTYELVSPVFVAKAELPENYGTPLHAGERLRVSFATEEQTLAGRYCRSVQAWAARLAGGSHD